MRVARDSLNHQRLARRAVQDGDALDRREPALINLPISLASIPLLDPIITPLIAGKGPESTTAPAPAPAPSPSNTSSGGNSGGNGSGSSGSGSGSSSSGSGSSGSSGNSGGGSSGGGNSGGGNSGGGNSGGGNSDGGSGNTSGGNTGGNTGNSGSSNGTGASSGSSPGNSIPSSSAGNSGAPSSSSSGSSGPSPSSSASGSHSGTGTGTGTGSAASSDSSIPVVVSASAGDHTGSTFASSSREQSDDTPDNVINVGSDPSSLSVSSSSNHAATVVSANHNAPSTVGSSSGGSSGSTTSGSGDGTGSGDSPGGEASQSGASHGLSTGAIAGIVVTAIVLWAIIFVFCLRRRYIARRAQRRTKWAGKGISNDTMNWSQTLMSNGTMSARSSFATTYDISTSGNSFRGEAPAMPVMAEIRDTHSPGFMTHTQQVDYHDATLVAPPSPLLINLDDGRERRDSTGSKRSSSSSVDPYSQYLVIRQPPGAVIGGNGSTLTPMSVRPFSPSEAFTFPKPPKTPGEETSQWIDNDTSIPSPAINPFIDTQAEFEETEVIRRPFVPTLDDEMRVSVGERVRIVQVFSDGWALVERRAVDDKKGKGASPEEIIRGLIPVDCFREAGEDLPAFLAAKRVSDYHDAATLRA